MKSSKPLIGWALYDWANSAFAAAVLTVFFPLFFSEFWSTGVEAGITTFRLGLANSIASLVVVLTAPLLGAIADQGSARKRFLLLFATLGITMTAGLFLVEADHWTLAAGLYVLAVIGFSGGNIFYDSLLITVSSKNKLHVNSSLGFALGYLGGGLLFAFTVYLTQQHQVFGIANGVTAVRIAFLLVAIWWAVFSIPLFLWVEEPHVHQPVSSITAITNGFRQLCQTFAQLRRLRTVFVFLCAYFLYIDGLDTIVRMAVDYGLAIGLASSDLVLAIMITQFVGFPAALAFGKLGERLGPRTGIYIGLAVYTFITVWAYFIKEAAEFYVLAALIGLVQGGVQALSRSLYSTLIPTNKAAEFFGFYNMLGKFAAVLGPLLVGGVSLVTGNPRYSILSILLLFGGGALLLAYVNV
ncbi:MAG TPA: MFS transporter, partial [Acidiferrobacteraceae bacterium]|nr:MFS transporter [Acidiferrobacteraceae bacterium]